MIFSSRASLSASRAPDTSAGLACEKVEMIRSVAFEPSGPPPCPAAPSVSCRATPIFR
jgi:hypothetical protein